MLFSDSFGLSPTVAQPRVLAFSRLSTGEERQLFPAQSFFDLALVAINLSPDEA